MDNNELWFPTITDADGVKHMEADMSDCDTDRMCDLDGHDTGITCPLCLGGLVKSLHRELMYARHHLAMSNPEGWECLNDCEFCDNGNYSPFN